MVPVYLNGQQYQIPAQEKESGFASVLGIVNSAKSELAVKDVRLRTRIERDTDGFSRDSVLGEEVIDDGRDTGSFFDGSFCEVDRANAEYSEA